MGRDFDLIDEYSGRTYIRVNAKKEIVRRVNSICDVLKASGCYEPHIRKILIYHFVRFYLYCLYKDDKIKDMKE